MSENGACVLCQRGDEQVPLIAFRFQGEARTICSQHLPVLIHEPAQLAGRLRGVEHLKAAEHKD